MRGVHSAVDDIRRSVFTEVARLAYESDDYKQVDMIPYKIVPGEVAHHRHDVFLERAIVSARLKLALGMDLDPNGPSAPISANIQDAATDQKYFNEPLVNIIPYACNACPPKQVRITDSCQGCISHPCMNVCPKDAIQCMYDEAPSILNYKIAEYTKAVVDGRPCFHVSLVMDVSPNCDCHGENDVPIVPNVGMFASFDPVALDQACIDAVLAQPKMPNSVIGSGEACQCEDHFKAAHPDTDWEAALIHSEKIGLGSREYELVKI